VCVCVYLCVCMCVCVYICVCVVCALCVCAYVHAICYITFTQYWFPLFILTRYWINLCWWGVSRREGYILRYSIIRRDGGSVVGDIMMDIGWYQHRGENRGWLRHGSLHYKNVHMGRSDLVIYFSDPYHIYFSTPKN